MKRIYYIDWLRIFAIAGVFLFHNSHFFDPIYWHVKNPVQSDSVLLFLGFVNLWIMPLFFFLSGGAGIFGIKKPFGHFVTGKMSRLLVPFIFGVLLLIPPQKYVEAISNGYFQGDYFQFLKEYFTGGIFYGDHGFSIVWIGVISYHLWFLGHLFVISLVSYKVLKYLHAGGLKIYQLINRITSFKGGALLMFVPAALVRVALHRYFPDYTSWCDFFSYLAWFLLGFLYTTNEDLKNSLYRDRHIAFITGTVLYVVYISSFMAEGTMLHHLFHDQFSWLSYAFQEAIGALATWSWLVFIVAMGMRYLNREHILRPALNEGVLPFYILHQTVLLLIGYIVVQWNWASWYKFIFIGSSSLLVIAVIYLLAIRPFNPMRYAFGMGKNKVTRQK